jgi:hypothetical protein
MLSLSPAEELVEIRATMARLAAREEVLTRIADAQPLVPVFRPGWPIQRNAVTRSASVWQRA